MFQIFVSLQEFLASHLSYPLTVDSTSFKLRNWPTKHEADMVTGNHKCLMETFLFHLVSLIIHEF